MDQGINMRMMGLFCAVLAWMPMTECSAITGVQNEIDCLYCKYHVNSNAVYASVVTDYVGSIIFDFEIPQKRQLYSVTISSNDVVVTLHDINGIYKYSAIGIGIDIKLIKLFRKGLLTYEYEPLSVTTGPKYVYVTICAMKNQYYKFDYPWWVSSRRDDIPPGMLLGLNACVSDVYRMFTTIFSRYIFPNIMKLQSGHLFNSRMLRSDHIRR